MDQGSNRRGRVLCALLALVYFVSYLTRLNFSAVMAELTAEGVAVLTKTQAGTVGTALFITYGAGQIISGWLSDRFRPENVIISGFFLTVICNLLMPLVGSAVLMTVVWGVNGFAQALFWPPIVRLMASRFDEDGYAKCNLVVSISCHLSTIFTYIAVAACVTFLNWKSVFFFSGGFAALAMVAFAVGFFFYRKGDSPVSEVRVVASAEEGKAPAEKMPGRTSLFPLFCTTGTVFILIGIMMQGFLKDGVQSWLPTFFTEAFGISSAGAILSNSVLPVFNILMVSLATVLYRKVFRNEVKEALLFFTVVVLCSLLLTLFMGKSAVMCLLLAATITGCAHGVNLMFISFVPRRFAGCGKVALVSGILNACTYIGSATSSYGVALIAEKIGWHAALLSWDCVALIGILMCLLAIRKWGRFIRPESK